MKERKKETNLCTFNFQLKRKVVVSYEYSTLTQTDWRGKNWKFKIAENTLVHVGKLSSESNYKLKEIERHTDSERGSMALGGYLISHLVSGLLFYIPWGEKIWRRATAPGLNEKVQKKVIENHEDN